MLNEGFQGKIYNGMGMEFSNGKRITRRMMQNHIDFIKNSNSLAAETFKVPLNFNFDCKVTFEILDIFLETTD